MSNCIDNQSDLYIGPNVNYVELFNNVCNNFFSNIKIHIHNNITNCKSIFQNSTYMGNLYIGSYANDLRYMFESKNMYSRSMLTIYWNIMATNINMYWFMCLSNYLKFNSIFEIPSGLTNLYSCFSDATFEGNQPILNVHLPTKGNVYLSRTNGLFRNSDFVLSKNTYSFAYGIYYSCDTPTKMSIRFNSITIHSQILNNISYGLHGIYAPNLYINIPDNCYASNAFDSSSIDNAYIVIGRNYYSFGMFIGATIINTNIYTIPGSDISGFTFNNWLPFRGTQVTFRTNFLNEDNPRFYIDYEYKNVYANLSMINLSFLEFFNYLDASRANFIFDNIHFSNNFKKFIMVYGKCFECNR